MQLFKLLTTASLALLASSAIVPSKRATSCVLDYSGDSRRSLGLESRQSSSFYCDCGTTLNSTTPVKLNQANADAAVAQMKAALPFSRIPSLQPHSSEIHIVGDVVAFFCNFDDFSWTEFGGDFGYGICRIGETCGSYVGGAYKAFPGDLRYTTGYMKYTPGLDVCATAKNISAQSC
jgi:hypothetical protein